MKNRIWMSVFAIICVIIGVGIVSGQEDQEATVCVIPENYSEASGENMFNILRLFSYLGDDGIWDVNVDTINLSYALLVSMREYHEDAQAQLPDCAQQLNDGYIRVISAMSDVLAYNWGILANPDAPTYYINRANLAKDDLNLEWATLSQLNQAMLFTTE